MWIGSVSHDNKVRFWNAGYLFEEDDDDEEEEDGEEEEATAGENGAANAGGRGGSAAQASAFEGGVFGGPIRFESASMNVLSEGKLRVRSRLLFSGE